MSTVGFGRLLDQVLTKTIVRERRSFGARITDEIARARSSGLLLVGRQRPLPKPVAMPGFSEFGSESAR